MNGPELRAHLKEIEEGNLRAREWANDATCDELVSLLGIAGSHCRISAEAAWLGDRALTEDHMRRARDALVLAIRHFNGLKTGETPSS
jgi:hypothetical protein